MRRPLIPLLLLLLSFAPAPRARAQFTLKGLGPTGGQVAAVAIGAGVIIGVGIYLIARHPRISGCVEQDPAGLSLHTPQSSPRTYTLLGKTAGLTAGQQVKVSGKRHKLPAGTPAFQVESLKKVYGPCSVSP